MELNNNTIEERLNSGTDPRDIFDLMIPVEGTELTWVNLGEKVNYLTKDNKILFDKWLKYAQHNFGEFGVIRDDDGYHIIDEKGNITSKENFESINHFKKRNISAAETKDGWVAIDKKGNVISKPYWYIDAGYTHTIAKISDGNFAILDDNGTEAKQVQCEEYSVYPRENDKFCMKVINGNKWNIINDNLEYEFEQWQECDMLAPLDNGYTVIVKNNKELPTKNGKAITNMWFDKIRECGKLLHVSVNGKYNLMNQEGDFILRKWSEEILHTGKNTFIVRYGWKEPNKMVTLVDDKGNNLLDTTCDNIYPIGLGMLMAIKDTEGTVIDCNGKQLIKKHFKSLGTQVGEFIILRGTDYKWNIINDKAELQLDKWADKLGLTGIEETPFVATWNGKETLLDKNLRETATANQFEFIDKDTYMTEENDGIWKVTYKGKQVTGLDYTTRWHKDAIGLTTEDGKKYLLTKDGEIYQKVRNI